jgi:hypothetical protein
MLHEAAPGDGPAAAVAQDDYTAEVPPPEHGAVEETSDYHFSPFADQEPLEHERRKPWLKVLLGLLLIAAVAAAFWFLAPPSWKSRLGLASAGETPLQLMMTHSDRQRLASGQEMLSISGRVINPTEKMQRVPPIQAQLRSSTGQLVYSWTIPAPTPRLGPGESKPFNDAKLDVPSGGDDLTLSLGVRGV